MPDIQSDEVKQTVHRLRPDICRSLLVKTGTASNLSLNPFCSLMHAHATALKCMHVLHEDLYFWF